MRINFEHLYEHIGYLFYSIACERGKLNAVTFDLLKRLVDQQWHPDGNGNSLESNLVTHLQSAMYNAYDIEMTAEDAFDLFKRYYDIHSLPFGKTLRSRILATTSIIGSEFSENGTKSEFTTRLKKLLAANSVSNI